MSTLTPLTELSDRDLMEQLRAHPGKTRLMREVERRIAPVIEAATRTLPDSGTAYNEALYLVTSPGWVEYFLDEWRNGSLATFTFSVARQNEVREAGLAGRAQKRNDPLYRGKEDEGRPGPVSLDAMAADGYTLAALQLDTRTAEQVEADERARVREIRETFIMLASSVLTDKQIEAVLRRGNIHRDDALPEMANHDAVAKSMRIDRSVLARHLAAAKKNAEGYPVLTIAIRELCGDWETAAKDAERLMVTA